MNTLRLVGLLSFLLSIALSLSGNGTALASDEGWMSVNGSKSQPVGVSETPRPSVSSDNVAIFEDNFDGVNDTTALKARGYKVYYRGSGPQGSTAVWFQGNPAVFNAYNGPTNGYVAANFNAVTGTNRIDSWLVLPRLNIASGDTIVFFERSPTANTFPDSIKVMYSAAGDSVPEGSWVELAYFRTTETGSWGRRAFTAPAGGANARFAIRYYVVNGGPSGTNSNFIGIDALSVVAGPSTPAGPSTAFAVDVRNQRLVKINLGTGAVTAFGGATGGRPFYAGDFGGNGVWYAVSTPDTLYSIDTTTGAFTNLGRITGLPAASNTSGMTWDYSTNTMYLSNLVGGVATLYTLNLATRVATSIGPILTGTVIDIAASNGGQIYGIRFATAAGVSDSLVSINKSTGAGTTVGPLGVDVNFAHGLDFDPSNDSLYYPGYIGGGVNNLYNINTTTGAAALRFSLAAGEYDAFSVRLPGPTGVTETGSEIPSGYALSQNYPNPFNPSTTIRFAIPVREHVTLKVYNTLGQEVATLHNGELSAGTFETTWNATGIASGVYFYRIQAGQYSAIKKLVLMK